MSALEPRRLLRKTTKQLTAVGTSDTLLFDQVPHGEQWFVDWVACMDSTTAITSWYSFIRTASGDYPIKQSADTTVSHRHAQQIQTWLTEGEQFGVVIVGATAADDLYAWLTGHYREVES